MCSGNEVYSAALAILDELEDSTELATYNNEYKSRSIHILNSLVSELMLCLGKGEEFIPLTDLNSPIPLIDGVCHSVLPYGLAANLCISDDPDSSMYCRIRYMELKSNLISASPAACEEIQDVYGGIGYNEFSRW